VQETDLIDFTPELKAQAREIFKQYRSGPLFTPPSVRSETNLGTLQLPGNQGSALWQGAAWDPELSMLFVPSVSNMTVQALQPGGTRSDMSYIGGAGGGGEAPQGGRAGGPGAAAPDRGRGAGPAPLAAPTNAGGFFPTPQFGRGAAPVLGPGASRGPWGLGPQGLPLVKPPYGRITAYNMNTGDIVWQVANGDTYDWIKSHPALKGVTIPKTGRADEGGIVVTKTLMFAGQGCGLFRAGSGGSEMFYAYDKASGAVVHEMALPGGTCGNPMTYAINGKQYIAVSVGSRTTTAEIVALALP
jgi:quinoprotein glucose dehydrogenase